MAMSLFRWSVTILCYRRARV